MTEPSDAEIAEILRNAKTIAVVGLSPDPNRASLGVSASMQRAGYRIVPVNPKHAGETILGETVVSRLEEIDGQIDIVDLFRRAVDVPRPVREAIAVGAGTVWMQLGIRNEEAAAEARAAGLNVVQDRCIAVEHRRLIRQAP